MAEAAPTPAPKKANYKPVFAILGAVVVVAILLTPTNAFASQTVSFVDTELRTESRGNHLMVNTRYPIGDAAKLERFPTTLGKWQTTHEYEWDYIAELLDTDVLIARDYRAPGVYVPVSLVIIQSTNMSSFHAAPVCYRAQGYTIVDNETAEVPVTVNDTAWARAGVFEGVDQRAFDGTILVKRLVVERSTAGGAMQRELSLYFYVKEAQGRVAQRVEWVRLSMYVPATGNYGPHEELLKQFMGEVVPELFVPSDTPEAQTLLSTLVDRVRG